MLLQGIFVPLTCPFYRDGSLYVRKLEHNVARYSLSPASGFLALPPGTEAAGLTDRESVAVLEAVGAVAAKEKVLLAGVEACSVAAALERIAAAALAQFDAVLLAAPRDLPSPFDQDRQAEHRLYFEAVADRSPLPVVLWSGAERASGALPLEFIATLAKHGNILGLVDGALSPERIASLHIGTRDATQQVTVTPVFEAVTRRMLQPAAAAPSAGSGFLALDALRGGGGTAVETALPVTAATLKTRTKNVGFQLLAANGAQEMVGLLSAGAAGAVPTLAAAAPQSCFEAFAAWKDGDPALAAERAARLAKCDALCDRLGVAGLKLGCDLNGYFGGMPRLPRLPLVAAERAAVEAEFASLRN